MKLNVKQLFNKTNEPISEPNSFQEWLRIKSIEKDRIILNNGKAVVLLNVLPVNFKLKSKLEQKAILSNYKNFLKGLNSKIQILILSKRTDVSSHIENVIKNSKNDSTLSEVGNDYIRLIKQIVMSKGTVTKEFYIIMEGGVDIENEIIKTTEYLNSCGNEVNVCDKYQIINVLRNCTNKRIESIA